MTGCHAGASATGATRNSATAPYRTSSISEVHTLTSYSRDTPVIRVAARA